MCKVGPSGVKFFAKCSLSLNIVQTSSKALGELGSSREGSMWKNRGMRVSLSFVCSTCRGFAVSLHSSVATGCELACFVKSKFSHSVSSFVSYVRSGVSANRTQSRHVLYCRHQCKETSALHVRVFYYPLWCANIRALPVCEKTNLGVLTCVPATALETFLTSSNSQTCFAMRPAL